MISISEMMNDPDFSQDFIIYRKRPSWVKGKTVLAEDPPLIITGVVIAAGTWDLQQVPEGDRIAGIMAFYSTNPLYVTQSAQISDEIVWNGERYKLLQVSDYRDYGYYKALGERMEGM